MITTWISSGINALVNIKRKNIWIWFIIDQRLDIDEIFIIPVKVIITALAPTIDWDDVFNTSAVSFVSEFVVEVELFPLEELPFPDVCEELATVHIPLLKLYPRTHWEQTELLKSDHVLQLRAIQLITVTVIFFWIGEETPTTVDKINIQKSASTETSGGVQVNKPVLEFMMAHVGAVDPTQFAMLYVIEVDPAEEQVRSGVTVRTLFSITENDWSEIWNFTSEVVELVNIKETLWVPGIVTEQVWEAIFEAAPVYEVIWSIAGERADIERTIEGLKSWWISIYSAENFVA